MTWVPAFGHLLAPPSGLPAHVFCDRCHKIKIAETQRGDLPMWVLRRNAPPGWLLLRSEDDYGKVERRDYCPDCRKDAVR